MAKTYIGGKFVSKDSTGSTSARGFIPRQNEIDKETRENRGSKRISSVEVLPASTAIINVYQLVDKVKANGKKMKLYYPGGVAGVGFAGFKKLRGIKMPKDEEVVMPSMPSTPKVTTATTSKPQAQPESKYKNPFKSAPAESAEIEKIRAEIRRYANNQPVIYRFSTDRIGQLNPLTKETEAQYQDRSKAYEKPAKEYLRVIEQAKGKPQEQSNIEQIKALQTEGRKASTSNVSLDKKNLFKLMDREKIPYEINDIYQSNDRYVARSFKNPDDIKAIERTIKNVKDTGRRFDEKPYAIVRVGTALQQPSTTQWIYTRGGLDYRSRRKKMVHSNAKRPMVGKKASHGNKRRVVMKKGGKR